jgi:ammonia channel protein AmtB
VDHVQATPELLESIRVKMQAERKVERTKLIIKTIIFLILLFSILYIFNYNWKWIEGFFYKVK